MGKNTEISWADHTFNPWVGCQAVSAACDHCYAEEWAKRYGTVEWGPHGERKRTSASTWRQPMKWQRDAAAFREKHGRRQRVFCASLADVFDNRVPVDWRRDLFDLIRATPDLEWMLLTKRPENVLRLLREVEDKTGRAPDGRPYGWPRNAALGVTVEDQAAAVRRIPLLLIAARELRPAYAFASCEPMLGPVRLRSIKTVLDNRPTDVDALTGEWFDLNTGCVCLETPAIRMVIVGGESGPHARPMHPDGPRWLREQCAVAGAAFHFKQWGEWLPGEVYAEGDRGGFVRHMDGTTDQHKGKPDHWWSGDTFGGVISTRVGKARAGRLLDGREHLEWPVWE